MSVIPFFLVAGSLLPSLISGAPVPFFPSRDVAGAASVHSFEAREASSAYTVFGGTGLVSEGWPSLDDWVPTFDEMFTLNKDILSSSCSQFDVTNNSEDEITNLSNSIQSVASSTGVDARFILAIVMQESNGCVRVPTTDYSVENPGLMQSHQGTGTCNSGGDVQDPCPESEITQMVTDGTAGTSTGDGLKQLLASTGVSDVTMYYLAARMYNSGSVASSGNLGQGVATHCYVSDVANRLIGWSTGASSCDDATIGELTDASGSVSAWSGTTTAAAAATTSATATATATPTVTAVTSATSTTAPATQPTTTSATSPAVTTTTTTSAVAAATTTSSDPIYPEAISTCTKYFTVTSGDYCLLVEEEAGITAAQLMDWNPGLDSVCSNLWLGYQYCIQA